MNYATDVSPVVVDIETAPLENVREFLDPPDLENLEPPKNYTKADTIAKWREEEAVKRLADFERDCTDKTALDFNCARIVALGLWTADLGVKTYLCHDAARETWLLDHFWTFVSSRLIVGFSIREFDLPMLIQRSRYLGVPHRSPDLGRYARGNGIIDLRDLLTFNDMRYEAIMPRSAKAFARRFGIPITDTISGKEIPALVAAGDWDAVEAHVRADVEMEVALAQRLGVIQQPVGVPS